MADIFSIGLSGLLAYQNAMTLTSHNVTNANTPNYSRRTIEFSEGASSLFGSGVAVVGQRRIFDSLANLNVFHTTSSHSKSDAIFNEAINFEAFLTNDSVSVTKGLDDVYTALQDLNNNPASLQNRQIYLEYANILENRFNMIHNEVVTKHTDVNAQMKNVTDNINMITSQLAELNTEATRPGVGSNSAMLDQRDALLHNLSEYINFNITEQDDGSLSVYAGTGTPLVFSGQSATLSTQANAQDPLKMDVVVDFNGASVVMSDFIDGGQLGGLLAFRRDILEPAMISLGRTALAVADSFNEQHKLGVDLQGDLGGDFFSQINELQATRNRVLPNINNTGSGDMTVSITDVNQLELAEYSMNYSSPTDYTLVRLSDNAQVAAGTLGALPQQIAVDGFTLNVNAGPFAANDKFIVSPTRNAANAIEVKIVNPSQLAIAAPIRTSSAVSNTGDASISVGSVTDTSTADFSVPGQLNPPVRIEFLSPTSYQVVNATTSGVIEGPITYDPASTNAVFPTPLSYDPGYRVELSGNAQAGDIFNIDYNADGVTDNRNGMQISNLYLENVLENNTMNFRDSYFQMSGQVSLQANFAEISYESSQILMRQAQDRRDAISGVNLDEEAVDLLRFEKAYQANAQVLSVANDMFDVMMNLLRR